MITPLLSSKSQCSCTTLDVARWASLSCGVAAFVSSSILHQPRRSNSSTISLLHPEYLQCGGESWACCDCRCAWRFVWSHLQQVVDTGVQNYMTIEEDKMLQWSFVHTLREAHSVVQTVELRLLLIGELHQNKIWMYLVLKT